MTIRVHLFARARDLAGTQFVDVELEDAATVGDLRCRLGYDYPALAALLANCAVAVDEEFADDRLSLRHGAVVAVLPPVSGGE